jgi:cytochrome b561
MQITDSDTRYGLISWLLHWLMFLAIVVVFALGLWMVDLDYYSPYYNLAPDVHRSVGILLLFALVFRFAWRVLNRRPDDHELSRFERISSHIVHWGFYPLLFALIVTGYLISTAKGEPVSVFGWFSIAATLQIPGQEDVAGYIHWLLAWLTTALVAVHAAAALKHHVVDRSRIMARMWSGPFSKDTQ